LKRENKEDVVQLVVGKIGCATKFMWMIWEKGNYDFVKDETINVVTSSYLLFCCDF